MGDEPSLEAIGISIGRVSFSCCMVICCYVNLVVGDGQSAIFKNQITRRRRDLGTDLAQIGEYAYYDDDQDPENSPYVLEPIRSTDAIRDKLRTATTAQQNEPGVQTPEQIDGVAQVQDDTDNSQSGESKK